MSGIAGGRRWTSVGPLVALSAALLASAASPLPTAAACAESLPLEEAARLPDAAVFTGRAVREDAEYRVVFEVDRWFTGGHPARIVLFRDELAGLVEPETGAIPAVLARTVSGDGFGFNRGELVIVTAVRNDDGQYAPVTCTQNVVPVATAEGRALVEEATDLFGPGVPVSRLPATSALADVAPAAGSSTPWLPVAAFLVALMGTLRVLARRRTAASAGSLLVAGLLVAGGCGQATTTGSPASASVPAATERATPTPTPTALPTPRPVPTPGQASAPPFRFTVDCGPLTACLDVAAAAETSLEVDRPPYTRVDVLPLDRLWTAPPAPSPSPRPAASPPVEIETFLAGYSIAFSWPSGSMVIPVFQGANGWTAGLPPAATRVYRFDRDAGTWTEPAPFQLGRAEYALGGGCGGDGSTPGGAVVVLQRVGNDGAVVAEAARLRCGPAESSYAFGETLRLDAGRYRLAVEGATGGLEVHLEPVTAE